MYCDGVEEIVNNNKGTSKDDALKYLHDNIDKYLGDMEGWGFGFNTPYGCVNGFQFNGAELHSYDQLIQKLIYPLHLLILKNYW